MLTYSGPGQAKMQLTLILAVVCLATLFVAESREGRRSFDGYTVIRVSPSTREHVQFLQFLEGNYGKDLDFWSHPGRVNRTVDIMVSPQKKYDVANLMEKEGLPVRVVIPNVEKAISAERDENDDLPMNRAPKSFFASFQRLTTIHNYLDELVAKNPEIASTFSIGQSTEGRQLKVLKISSGSRADKPVFWMDGGIHAREWISPATVTFIATQLVEGFSTNDDIRKLVDDYDWYILPVVNADGYEYTHTSNRMWRKTRSRTNSLWGCRGTDPNRNFGHKWMTGGSSSDPCSDTYAGQSAFSEPETKAVSDFVLTIKDRVKAFVTVHSYSQLWLFPWGWTNALPKDYAQMKAAADVAVGALYKVYGTSYEVGTSTNVLYIASGGSDDWAYGGAGIKYSYTVELRDTGKYGFILPPNQIVPSGIETFEGIKALANYITNNP